MSVAMIAAKCAQAVALMEEAQRLVDEVLDDPAYIPAMLPGVVPEGVADYLPDAIGMLTPEEPEPHRRLRLVK